MCSRIAIVSPGRIRPSAVAPTWECVTQSSARCASPVRSQLFVAACAGAATIATITARSNVSRRRLRMAWIVGDHRSSPEANVGWLTRR